MTFAEQHARTAPATRMTDDSDISLGIDVVVVTIADGEPMIATTDSSRSGNARLPGSRFDTVKIQNLDDGLKSLFGKLGDIDVFEVDQLRTSGFRDQPGKSDPFKIAIGYLGLTGGGRDMAASTAGWRSWYDFLPWENRRGPAGDLFAKRAAPLLEDWAKAPECAMDVSIEKSRQARSRALFAVGGGRFDEERAPERYRLLKEAKLVEPMREALTGPLPGAAENAVKKTALDGAHLELLALGVQRLRARLRHWPIVAGLMPHEFTLFELQRVFEGVLGSDLHKQNFRRFVETARVLEETGELRNHTGGRPAKLFRFNRDVLANTHGEVSPRFAET